MKLPHLYLSTKITRFMNRENYAANKIYLLLSKVKTKIIALIGLILSICCMLARADNTKYRMIKGEDLHGYVRN